MSTRDAAAALAVALGVLVGACGGDAAGPEGPGSRPTSPPPAAPEETGAETPGVARMRCRTEIAPPAGFAPIGTFRVREADHVGIRESYRDPEGRELHVTAGISGEFAEGGEVVEVTLASGEPARIAGSGTDWVLLWESPPPCEQRTVGGAGFASAGFVDVLVEMGLLAPS